MTKINTDLEPTPEQLRAVLDSTFEFEQAAWNACLVEGQDSKERLRPLDWYSRTESWISAMNPLRLTFQKYKDCGVTTAGWPSAQVLDCLSELHQCFIDIVEHWGLEPVFGAKDIRINFHLGNEIASTDHSPTRTGHVMLDKPPGWPPPIPTKTMRRLTNARERLDRTTAPVFADLNAERDRKDLAAKIAAEMTAVQSPFVPTKRQTKILAMLNGKAKNLDQLSVTLKVKGPTLSGRDLKELKKAGKVKHSPRIGYYRPDAPPPELALT